MNQQLSEPSLQSPNYTIKIKSEAQDEFFRVECYIEQFNWGRFNWGDLTGENMQLILFTLLAGLCVASGCRSDDSGSDTYPGVTCANDEWMSAEDIDCMDTNGPIEGCMDNCGAVWEGLFGNPGCVDGLVCADADCADTDGPSGYCYPITALECENDSDCDCLPSPCSNIADTPCGDQYEWGCGELFWTCDAGMCKPIFLHI
jgi:hypothetical protein